MYGRGFEMPQPERVDVMVHRRNVENASFVLVNFHGFFQVLAHGPYSLKAVESPSKELKG